AGAGVALDPPPQGGRGGGAGQAPDHGRHGGVPLPAAPARRALGQMRLDLAGHSRVELSRPGPFEEVGDPLAFGHGAGSYLETVWRPAPFHGTRERGDGTDPPVPG